MPENLNLDQMNPIRLMLSEEVKPADILESHFWGDPDLPAGSVYPEYENADGESAEYRFVCQINLEDLVGMADLCGLPQSGLLSFFAKIDHYLGDYDDLSSIGGSISGSDDVRVLFFPEPDKSVFRKFVLVDELGKRVNPSEMKISFSYAGSLTSNIGEHCDRQYQDEHFLFAEPVHREWEFWDHPYEDWIILLQLDSFSGKDFNLNFMDCGVMVFLIHPEDLRKCDFSNVRAIVLST